MHQELSLSWTRQPPKVSLEVSIPSLYYKMVMEKRIKNELLGLVRAISGLNCARPFLYPVDPVALNIPDYPTIITKPMDLSTIKVSAT